MQVRWPAPHRYEQLILDISRDQLGFTVHVVGVYEYICQHGNRFLLSPDLDCEVPDGVPTAQSKVVERIYETEVGIELATKTMDQWIAEEMRRQGGCGCEVGAVAG